MSLEIESAILELKRDIEYFKLLEFNVILSKFQRDLNIIEKLMQRIDCLEKGE